jgi:hypothetical protein
MFPTFRDVWIDIEVSRLLFFLAGTLALTFFIIESRRAKRERKSADTCLSRLHLPSTTGLRSTIIVTAADAERLLGKPAIKERRQDQRHSSNLS